MYVCALYLQRPERTLDPLELKLLCMGNQTQALCKRHTCGLTCPFVFKIRPHIAQASLKLYVTKDDLEYSTLLPLPPKHR